jgi:hypothetical protein
MPALETKNNLTELSHPPDLGLFCNQEGKSANSGEGQNEAESEHPWWDKHIA